MKLEYIVTNTTSYQNIKEILKCEFGISDRLLLFLKRNNGIFQNGVPAFSHLPVSLGDIISVCFDTPEDNTNIVPTKMPLDILYEDDWFLVINKPAGISTHPSMAHYGDSLSNGVRYYFDTIHLPKKIRPINRLDKNTSGLILFAKNEYIQHRFSIQMQSGVFSKEYLTIVEGSLSDKKRNY